MKIFNQKYKINSNIDPNRVIGLDAIRAIAILVVVWYHSFPILAPLIGVAYIGPIIKKTTVASTWIGPLGVDLFFVLSGFLIGTIIISIFLKSKDFGFKEIKNFWIRRWFRTIPNYYFLLIVASVLYYFKYNLSVDWRYFLFIQNFSSIHPKFFAEAWSLAVEEWFYISLPIYLYIISKFFSSIGKNKILQLTFFSYLIVFITLRFIKAEVHDYTDFDREIRKIVIYRLDSVMYGVIVAYFMKFHKVFLEKYKRHLFFIGTIGALILVAFYFYTSEYNKAYFTNEYLRLFIDSSYFTLIPFFFALFIPAAYFYKGINNKTLKFVIVNISLISYSLYLTHYALIYIPFFENLDEGNWINCILYYLLYWTIIIIISVMNYNLFEKPFVKIRDILSNKE